jgi:hypothetical protein
MAQSTIASTAARPVNFGCGISEGRPLVVTG